MVTHTLTDVPGFTVGHATNTDAATGCTAILCPPATVGGVDVRGGAPGTRETDLLQPHNRVEEVSAVMLAGGSAYGLAAAQGAVEYLAEHGRGYKTGQGFLVPIVPSAILFDLGLGASDVFPTQRDGYTACTLADDGAVAQGNVGAGTGAVCGAMRGIQFATKGGLGSASIDLGAGLYVGALVAVNAVGDVLDEDGAIMAGVRGDDGTFMGMLNALRGVAHEPDMGRGSGGENTVIGVVATNAKLTKPQVHRVAQMAHGGISRVIQPSHTEFDGDTIFALASGEKPSSATVIGAFAAVAMAEAIRSGIRHAKTLYEARSWDE